MRVTQFTPTDLQTALPDPEDASSELVVVFGSVERLDAAELLTDLRRAFPGALLAGCSTAGEISAEGVADGTLTITSMRFEQTLLRSAWAVAPRMEDSRAAGEELAMALRGDGLTYLLLLADGVHINGSALLDGITAGLGNEVLVTGGLAGDAGRFSRTLVLCEKGVAERSAVAVGFYGSSLRVGHGSMGGWESFGPIRRVTRSSGNVVEELDGKPALAVYESYLGEDAKDLPGSGLFFPLALVTEDCQETGLIRTLLGVDRRSGSLVFAGNVPEGGLVRMMHASFDGLVTGAGSAAVDSLGALGGRSPAVALLVSCVGRRLLMGTNIEQELEAVQDVLGSKVPLAGFYSNGEISPFVPTARCELHNQTMTITTFSELP